MSFLGSYISEIRLQAGSSCRAWSQAHGCFTASEWEREYPLLPWIRPIAEAARLRISEVLTTDGVDPMGISRRLLIHESAATLSRKALRAFGFVHLESASGLHLYALAGFSERLLSAISARVAWSTHFVRVFRFLGPIAIWVTAFFLMGFRMGLWRPFILVTLRWTALRLGFRWVRWAPLGISLTIDLMIGLFTSFGSEARFSDWAPGELHYALAWWGGVIGYDWARARGLGPFYSHVALSVGSWLTVLPLDLASGGFAPATPIFSLITVEVLTRGGYLALLVTALGVALDVSGSREALQWLSLGFNRGVSFLFECGVSLGLGREVVFGAGAQFILLILLGVLLVFLMLSVRLKSSGMEGGGDKNALKS